MGKRGLSMYKRLLKTTEVFNNDLAFKMHPKLEPTFYFKDSALKSAVTFEN